jgi:hypothetical protein
LGGLIFAADLALSQGKEDANKIVIGPDVTKSAIDTFEGARGQKPNAEQLEALERVWLDNEVLYREGLSLGVDKGDEAIRERVIFKTLSLIDSKVEVPTPDEATLRAWFESHRNKYDEPARFDFEEAALSNNGSETKVREFAAALNGGTPGDARRAFGFSKDGLIRTCSKVSALSSRKLSSVPNQAYGRRSRRATVGVPFD